MYIKIWHNKFKIYEHYVPEKLNKLTIKAT